MNELFGVSMNLIMYVLLAVLAVALSSLAYVWLRNRVMFRIGVRNIPRRRAQTTLIVLGLMLSTLIISAAFTTGDTVDRSITSQVYNLLGSVDQVVQPRTALGDESVEEEDENAISRPQAFRLADVQSVIDRLRSNDLIDAVVPVYADLAVAVNMEKRLSAPVFNVVGVDPQAFGELPDLQDVSGGHRRVSELGAGEMFINRSAAEEMDARAGDRITLGIHGQQHEFTVRGVVEDKRLAGSTGISIRRQGGVVPLAVAQELFEAQGQATSIAVSNRGNERAGLAHAEEAAAVLRGAFPGMTVAEVKSQSVRFAEQGANFFTTFFLALGLFSIGAGVLLIFMIFLMLAAERMSEMGMARAVGTKRGDLVQTFLAEGMSYNVLAAAVGTGFGVAVAFVIARVMASLFATFDIDISPHVTARSLVISYSLGVVLTFVTVTFSSWRISNINIVRAIRDIPEPGMRRPNWREKGLLVALRDLVFKRTHRDGWVDRGMFLAAVVLLAAGGVFMPLLIAAAIAWALLVALIAARRVEFGPFVRFLVALLMLAVTPLTAAIFFFQTVEIGPLLLVLGAALTALGAGELNAFALYGGLSFLTIGLALLIRSFGANERITYTTAGLVLLYIWLFDFEFKLIDSVFGRTDGDIEMFFLSGVMITVASVFLLVYNSDIFVVLFTFISGLPAQVVRWLPLLGKMMPSIRMAIAYPLANKARTGMTMAMFCLVVFALIVMSAMNHNFNHVFVSDRSLGGWQVYVDENPGNPIPDLRQALRDAGSEVTGEFRAVGTVLTASLNRTRVCELRPGADCTPETRGLMNYRVYGDDPAFLRAAELPLQTRATGYASDADAWAAVERDPRLVIVDSGALTGDFGPAVIQSVKSSQRTMEPVSLLLVDRRTGSSVTVSVVGVIEMGPSNWYQGIHMSDEGFRQAFGDPDRRRFYVQTVDGADNRAVARAIESTLLTSGVQAESLKYEVDRLSSLFSAFLRLLQGFMGLGLFVGVAAVGVIAYRTVVERRQQIGMLRALGYTRAMIGLTFVLESAFIAAGGIATGIGFGLILARYLIHDEFSNQGVVDFVIPYTQVAVIGGLAFLAALLMTLLPSRQAAGMPIATALRYE